MMIRLTILLVVFVCVLGYFLTYGFPTKEVPVEPVVGNNPKDPAIYRDDADDPGNKQELTKLDIPGEEPPEEPVFHVTVTVDPTDGKDRLYYDITEEHGYFVETLNVAFRHTTSGWEVHHYINGVLRQNGTHSGHFDLSSAEIAAFLEGDMGSTGDWTGEVYNYHSARVEEPDSEWDGWDKIDVE